MSAANLPGEDPAEKADDPRHVFIRRVTGGRSFIDVGGLSHVINERVSVAHKAGAAGLALMDVESPDAVWWPQLRERLDRKGVGECQFISGDILKQHVATYDV